MPGPDQLRPAPPVNSRTLGRQVGWSKEWIIEFGAHLPLILAAGERSPDAGWIAGYAATAEALGYTAVSSNDHVMYRSPWLDGPTTLAVAAAATKRVRIAT